MARLPINGEAVDPSPKGRPAKAGRGEKPVACPDPWLWIAEGRWAGDRRYNPNDHECERSAWFSGRWASKRAPRLQPGPWHKPVIGIVVQPSPPAEGVDGLMAGLCCPVCPHAAVCGGGEPAKSCRTCRRVVADDGWRCGLDGQALDADMQRAACEAWEKYEDGTPALPARGGR